MRLSASQQTQPLARTLATRHAQGQASSRAALERQSTVSPIHKFAPKYDVRNISAPGMRELGQELYDNGTIGLKELGALTLLPMEAVSSEKGMELRPVQSSEHKFDMISNLEGALEFDKNRGAEGREVLENALGVLKMMDAARKGPVNVMA